MKKIFVIVTLLMFYTVSFYGQTLRQTANKAKYENIFYKTTSTNYTSFNVEKIVYITSHIGSKSEHKYQIAFYGRLKGEKKQLVYNGKSTDELQYFKEVFEGRYKRVNLFESNYKVGGKNYFNTSIEVEY